MEKIKILKVLFLIEIGPNRKAANLQLQNKTRRNLLSAIWNKTG